MTHCGKGGIVRACIVATTACLSIVTGSLAQENDLMVGTMDYGKLPGGKAYPLQLVIANVDCEGRHDFRIDLIGDTEQVLHLVDGPIVRGIGTGEERHVPAVLDLRSASARIYGGQIAVVCTSCPATCELDRRLYAFIVEVVHPGGSAPPTATPMGPLPAPPTPRAPTSGPPTEERRNETMYCGPDVDEEFQQSLVRLRLRLVSVGLRLPPGEGQAAAARAFKERNLPTPSRALQSRAIDHCPTQNVECAATVSVHGVCVVDAFLGFVLEGFTDASLRLGDGRERWIQNPPAGADQALVAYHAAYALGYELSEWAEKNPKGDLKLEWRVRWLHLEEERPIAAALFNRHRQCTICPREGWFVEDWTKSPWELPDGTLLENLYR